jgi:hypothetical protein
MDMKNGNCMLLGNQRVAANLTHVSMEMDY